MAAAGDLGPAESMRSSPDGQWVAIRRGREISLLAAGAPPAVGMVMLDHDDADHALVGPPTMLAIVTRDATPRVTLHQPPYLDAVARLDLDMPMRIAAITGPRIALISADGKHVQIVRAAGRALSSQTLELESPVEFAVGLERSQVLFSLLKKLEVWDAVAGRPLLRMQLQLPPAPRTVGPAQGHIWAMRPGSEEIFVYRLSDGRPFRHLVGAPVEHVIYHPASPVVVFVTARGLVRLHCFAHSLSVVDAPWMRGHALAQLVTGDDITLIGLGPDDDEPWRVPIGGTVAGSSPSVSAPESDAAPPSAAAPAPAGDRMRPLRERGAEPVDDAATPPSGRAADRMRSLRDRGKPDDGDAVPARGSLRAGRKEWRDAIAECGLELARGGAHELPVVGVDTELGALAHRLGLTAVARRALVALYGLYLIGEPPLSIASLAHVLGDWTEPLGRGELATFAMLHRERGRVGLRAAVTDLLDGATPRTIRIIGGPAGAPHAGAWRVAREGKPDAELEVELAARFGRIAVIDGDGDTALLEARLHGATAVAFHPPDHRPRPWPRDAGLVLVLYGSATSWIADVPSLPD